MVNIIGCIIINDTKVKKKNDKAIPLISYAVAKNHPSCKYNKTANLNIYVVRGAKIQKFKVQRFKVQFARKYTNFTYFNLLLQKSL